jgi:DNA repair protein RadC
MKNQQATPLFTLKKLETTFPSVKITDSKTSADFIRQFYFEDINVFESFFLLTLNTQNITTGYAKISQGGVSATMVDIKIVAKYAVENLANAVILAHNHPSGNLQPSDHDIKLTEKIKQGLQLLDIRVLDHVILTENSYYSLLDNFKM